VSDEEIASPKYPIHASLCHTEGMSFPHSKIVIDPAAFITADLENLRAEAVAAEEQETRDRLFRFIHYDLSQIFSEGGYVKTPTPSVEQLLKEAANWDANQLKQEIELVCECHIEKMKDAKASPALNHMKDQLEDMAWHQKPLIYNANPNRHDSRFIAIDDVPKRLEFEREAREILDEGIDYYSKLQTGYETQLQTLSRHDQQSIRKMNENVKLLNRMCKNARKAKETMIKIASEYRRKDKIDGKEAITYAENRDRFFTLERQYINLHSEIVRFVDTTRLSITEFPARLNIDESSGETWILEAAKKERSKTAWR